MTIKRKIFISNILIIAMPLLITVLAVCVIAMIYMAVSGIPDLNSAKESSQFNSSIYEISELSKSWTENTSPEKIKKDIDDFNLKYEKNKITLYAYLNNEPLFSNPEIEALLSDKLELNEETIIIKENSAFYCLNHYNYTLIALTGNYTIKNYKLNMGNYNIGFILFIILIAAIIGVSFMFSNFLSKSITRPIDILINGVHQIRDGNLSFRIIYDKKDEFAGVCADFNEMAARLNDSVEQRKKDELNRRELIAGISHDLRSPLTSIKAYLEGIEKGVANTPEIYSKYLNTVKNKTNELETIIEQLFLFSKMDTDEYPFHFETADIALELKQFLHEVKEEYSNKGLKISFTAEEENLYSSIDIQQFRNIISNIIANSAKYKDKETGEILITCRKENNEITIELSDDGPGVPAETLDKLFDVFYRCDSSRNNKKSGSGLGLAIALKAVEKMDGSIQAKNNEAGGLAMIITLPGVAEEQNEKNTDN